MKPKSLYLIILFAKFILDNPTSSGTKRNRDDNNDRNRDKRQDETTSRPGKFLNFSILKKMEDGL